MFLENESFASGFGCDPLELSKLPLLLLEKGIKKELEGGGPDDLLWCTVLGSRS